MKSGIDRESNLNKQQQELLLGSETARKYASLYQGGLPKLLEIRHQEDDDKRSTKDVFSA